MKKLLIILLLFPIVSIGQNFETNTYSIYTPTHQSRVSDYSNLPQPQANYPTTTNNYDRSAYDYNPKPVQRNPYDYNEHYQTTRVEIVDQNGNNINNTNSTVSEEGRKWFFEAYEEFEREQEIEERSNKY